MIKREERIGDCTLINGDMLECIDKLGVPQKNAALLTDPPYGIRADESAAKSKRKWGWKDYGFSNWDRHRPQKENFDRMLAATSEQIIWGGNYFSDFLPPKMRWLIWDKNQRDFSLADFEMAWTSQNKAARAFDYPRSLALRDGKQHPTQKPVALMKWCLGFLNPNKTVLDPFMGSGTTLVACAKLGRKGIGIELDPDYFEIAVERVRKAYEQPDLFIPAPEQPVQQTMKWEDGE